MLELNTNVMEVRGVKHSTSKKGNDYYNLNVENIDNGDAYSFYVNDSTLFPPNMKKGDKVKLCLNYTPYKELHVIKIVEVK